MTPEELLERRYIVIAKYPSDDHYIGEILIGSSNKGVIFSEYPKIFSPLAWYHYRDEKDMPMYVKCLSKHDSGKIEYVEKVEEWLRNYTNNSELISGFSYTSGIKGSKNYPKGFEYKVRMSLQGWLPATEEEYSTYKMILG